MKKVIAMSTFLVLAGASTVAFAQSAETPAAPATPATVEAPAATDVVQDEKVKITAQELPAEVKKTLEGDAYKGWEVAEVFHNKTKEIYELSVKKEAETKTLKFSKDGKAVE